MKDARHTGGSIPHRLQLGSLAQLKHSVLAAYRRQHKREQRRQPRRQSFIGTKQRHDAQGKPLIHRAIIASPTSRSGSTRRCANGGSSTLAGASTHLQQALQELGAHGFQQSRSQCRALWRVRRRHRHVLGEEQQPREFLRVVLTGQQRTALLDGSSCARCRIVCCACTGGQRGRRAGVVWYTRGCRHGFSDVCSLIYIVHTTECVEGAEKGRSGAACSTTPVCGWQKQKTTERSRCYANTESNIRGEVWNSRPFLLREHEMRL